MNEACDFCSVTKKDADSGMRNTETREWVFWLCDCPTFRNAHYVPEADPRNDD